MVDNSTIHVPGGLKGRGLIAAAERSLFKRSENIPLSVVCEVADGFLRRVLLI